MLITLAVTSLPWVTLGQVSKTLLANRTHLTQLEVTRLLFCQFDCRAVRTLSLWSYKAGRWWDTRSQTLRETQGPAPGREHPQGSAETLRSCPRLPDMPASASRRCRNKSPQTVQVKWFPTFRRGKSGCWAALVLPGGSGQEFFLSACHPRLHLTHHPASTQGSEPPPPFI